MDGTEGREERMGSGRYGRSEKRRAWMVEKIWKRRGPWIGTDDSEKRAVDWYGNFRGEMGRGW